MPLGAFRLNSFYKKILLDSEEYFFMYNTSLPSSTSQFDTARSVHALAVDDEKNIFLEFFGNDPRTILKINEQGSLLWQKTLSGISSSYNYREMRLSSNNNPIVSVRWPGTSGAADGRFGWIELDNLLGTEVRKQGIGIGNNNGSANPGLINVGPDGIIHGQTNINAFGFSNYRLIRTWLSNGNVRSSRLDQSGLTYRSSLGDSQGNTIVSILGFNRTTYFKFNQTNQVWGFAITSAAAPDFLFLGDNNSIYAVKNIISPDRCQVVKISSTGSIIWQGTLPYLYNTGRQNVCIDEEGNVYILTFNESVRFGSLYKISSTGNLLFSRTIKVGAMTNIQDRTMSICVKNGNMYIGGRSNVVGSTEGTFLLKLPSDGSLTGTYGNFVYSVSNESITPTSLPTTSASAPAVVQGNFPSATRNVTIGNASLSSYSKLTIN